MAHTTIIISSQKRKKNRICELSAQGCNCLFQKKKRFDSINNHGRNKLANFRLDNISKINYRTLVVLSYILLELASRKV